MGNLAGRQQSCRPRTHVVVARAAGGSDQEVVAVAGGCRGEVRNALDELVGLGRLLGRRLLEGYEHLLLPRFDFLWRVVGVAWWSDEARSGLQNRPTRTPYHARCTCFENCFTFGSLTVGITAILLCCSRCFGSFFFLGAGFRAVVRARCHRSDRGDKPKKSRGGWLPYIHIWKVCDIVVISEGLPLLPLRGAALELFLAMVLNFRAEGRGSVQSQDSLIGESYRTYPGRLTLATLGPSA